MLLRGKRAWSGSGAVSDHRRVLSVSEPGLLPLSSGLSVLPQRSFTTEGLERWNGAPSVGPPILQRRKQSPGEEAIGPHSRCLCTQTEFLATSVCQGGVWVWVPRVSPRRVEWRVPWRVGTIVKARAPVTPQSPACLGNVKAK